MAPSSKEVFILAIFLPVSKKKRSIEDRRAQLVFRAGDILDTPISQFCAIILFRPLTFLMYILSNCLVNKNSISNESKLFE